MTKQLYDNSTGILGDCMTEQLNFVDTHCHIHFANYSLPTEEVIESAKKANVKKIICVGCSLDDSKKAVELAAKHDNVWASVGAHPHDGQDFLRIPEATKILKTLSKEPKVVAIGEIGLDYFHEHSSKADQEKALRQQLEIGIQTSLPFIFHIRDAYENFWKILSDYQVKNAVVHSFSAGEKELDQILERDFFVGLNGIMTFTKDESQLEAAKKVPLDKLLLETDAPFLTPKPDRGKVCEPRHIIDTAKFLAVLRNESLEQIASASTANAEKLFKI